MTDLVLQFDSILTEKEITKEFQSFLKLEGQESTHLFLLENYELKNLIEAKEIIEKTIHMVEIFILPNSKHELKVSSESKQYVFGQYQIQKTNSEEWIMEEIPTELFEDINEIITQELYHDHWKRFLRTKIALNLIEKFKHNSDVCMPQISEYFPHDDEYFKHPFIFSSDFEFADLLFKDNFHWEVLFLFN
jgi:hypothetical protein